MKGKNNLFSNFYIKKPKNFLLASLAGNEGKKWFSSNFYIKKPKQFSARFARRKWREFFSEFLYKKTKNFSGWQILEKFLIVDQDFFQFFTKNKSTRGRILNLGGNANIPLKTQRQKFSGSLRSPEMNAKNDFFRISI